MQHLSFLEILQICRFRGFLLRLVTWGCGFDRQEHLCRPREQHQAGNARVSNQERKKFWILFFPTNYLNAFKFHSSHWCLRSTRRLELSVGPALPVRSSAMNFRIGDKVLITSTGFDKIDWFGEDLCHSLFFLRCGVSLHQRWLHSGLAARRFAPIGKSQFVLFVLTHPDLPIL